MLHITNGGSAAGLLRAAGLPGEVLSWDDVLHDGPVPGDISFNQLRAIRAQFIFDCGWSSFEDALRTFTERDRALERSLSHDEIVLWFEHDLYDQLQILQLLDWFATCELGATRLTMICDAEYLGSSTAQRLAERFPTRRPVTDAHFDVARRGWRAFRSDDPTSIESFLLTDTSALPFVHSALTRLLEQFPSTVNGLSRTESQALAAFSSGVTKLGNAFVEASQKREDAVFLGDSSFAMYLTALSAAKEPLLVTQQGSRLTGPPSRAFWNTEVRLTDAGRYVAMGAADHIKLNGIDRWIGGVHLQGGDASWRWDPAAQRLRSLK